MTFGACFTFIAAAARAGAALGRDGAFPTWFGVTGADGRSLVVQASGAAPVAVAALAAPTVVDVDLLMRAFSVLVASVTLLGLAVCGGPLVLLAVAVAVAALAWRRYHPAPRELPAGTPVTRPAVGTTSRRIAVVDVQPRRSYDLVNPGAGISASTRSRPASER
ncbi:hypothetical protein ACGF5C_27130 [Micromonospora sp. NPDC047620]|uniref:hypothetical protein n=1 Tax=Micromonospora sp. NPDC047620 TaxID=3364251 RepID=UPI003717C3D4